MRSRWDKGGAIVVTLSHTYGSARMVKPCCVRDILIYEGSQALRRFSFLLH